MKKEILIKYLNNNCSENEFEELHEWLEDKQYNEEGRNWSFEQWKTFSPNQKIKDEKKYDALLDKIHHTINLEQQENEVKSVISFSKVSKLFSRVAAILFIPMLGIIFYFHSHRSVQIDELADLTVDSLEVISPIGSRTTVQLSDGTEVNLNYGSKIKYPRNFYGNSREIILSGEAYFDVAYNPDKPFIVKADKLNVTAIGTEFNVQAYPVDDFIATTLMEGKVIIEKQLPGKKSIKLGTMMPGQHVDYNTKNGKIIYSKGNIDKYIAWRNGEMVFDNDPITKVVSELNHKFNVEIEVADNIKNLTYTVTFLDDPLFLILDLMAETTPIKYKRLPREKLPDGSYSKQKIIIEKR